MIEEVDKAGSLFSVSRGASAQPAAQDGDGAVDFEADPHKARGCASSNCLCYLFASQEFCAMMSTKAGCIMLVVGRLRDNTSVLQRSLATKPAVNDLLKASRPQSAAEAPAKRQRVSA